MTYQFSQHCRRFRSQLLAATIGLTLLVACGRSEPVATPTIADAPSEDQPTPTPEVAAETATPQPTAPPATAAAAEPGEIAFYSERDGNAEIYIMNEDGSDQRRLTANQFDDTAPAWSPDGSQIAFVSDRDDPNPGACGTSCFYQIYLINSDGSGEHRLVETEVRALHPDWHPDGGRLTFDSESDFQGDIYVVNADGSDLQLLIQDGFWADWSPDGRQIVFASNRDGNVELYVAGADGRNQRRLTENSRLDFFPAWSPDGQRIAFAVAPQRQLYLINADGSGEQLLDSLGASEDPAWSPDGRQLAFQSSQSGNFEIYVADVAAAIQGSDGGEPRRLTGNRVGDFWPAWRPAASSQGMPGSGSTIGAPPGNAATIDGLFSPGEWAGALAIDLAHGQLFLMHNGAYLYLGIRSDTLGLGSVCVMWQDAISILHSSAALGTATYVETGDAWQKTQDFNWTNRETANNEQALAARQEHLARENWLASNGLMGNANEMEYQILMTDGEILIGVAYLMSPDYLATDYWPETLAAGCRDFEPLPGDAPETVDFAPETWMTVFASAE